MKLFPEDDDIDRADLITLGLLLVCMLGLFLLVALAHLH